MATSNSITLSHIQDFFTVDKKLERIDMVTTLTGGMGINNLAEFPPPEPIQPKRREGTSYINKFKEMEIEELSQTENRQTVDLPDPPKKDSMNAVEELSTVHGDIASLNELESESAQQVYSVYYRDPVRYSSSLTITKYREEILQLININQVVIIQGSTGCGKTTQVPQYILDHYASSSKYCNIVVTQPRKIAAMSIARRVCHERKWQLGTIVGYQVAMDNKTSADTRISYVTTGVLLQKLINNRRMDMYTHVIIDEVHERDRDTDFALLVVKKLLRTNSRHVKVVLMSATIDTTLFANYFSFPGRGDPAPIIEIEGKTKEVTEHYLQELSALGLPMPELDPCNPGISDVSYDIVLRLLYVFDKIEKSEQKVSPQVEFAPSRGTVLMFLPGYEEISRMTTKLRTVSISRKFWLLPLHSSITVDEQNRVFAPAVEGYRKIIISTNIAESSITVPDIKYVIDFCLTKSLVCDPDTNYSCLQLEWASKANCTQRKGRAGRVDIGRVYRMVTREFYEKHLPEYGIPEMKRCPLDQLILFAKTLNFCEPQALLALALEPPDLSDIAYSILSLKEVGALALTVDGVVSAYDGDLTFIGRVMAALPLDIKVTKLIIYGCVFNCLEECVIIAASLSLKSFLSKPFQKLLDSYKSALSWADGSFSDCIGYLNAYREWKKFSGQGYFQRPGALSEERWCVQNFIQIRRIKEVDLLVKEIKKRLQPFNMIAEHPERSSDDIDIMMLKFVIAAAFFPYYYVEGEIDEKEALREVSNHDPCSTVVISGLPPRHGVLYCRAIHEMMSVCSPHMRLEFSEKKAYILFDQRHSNEESPILPPVYSAVKMRQMRMPLELQVFSYEDAERKLQQLQDLQQPNSKSMNKLSSNSIVIQSGSYWLKQVPLPPISRLAIEIFITEFLNCGHFWARYRDQKTNSQLEFLNRAINMHGGKNLLPLDSKPTTGMLVLAPYSERRNGPTSYYRATVEEVTPKGVVVFFVDYGNISTVNVKELRKIDIPEAPDVKKTPALAFECQLCEIKPLAALSSKGQWTNEANNFFKALIYNKELTARVYSVVQNIVRLELYYVVDRLQTCVNKELVDKGYAESAEESYASKSNNQLRMDAQSLLSEQLETSESAAMEFTLSEMEDSSNIRKMHHKIRLHGPYSPLEITYKGLTYVDHSKAIKIDRDSVNSVSLNPEPQDKSSRLLVACHVTLNLRSNTLTARSTTLMPKIKGLPSLLCLLFAPTSELRTDPAQQNYIGALCGLGCDPLTGRPLYKDHDVEITFDTVIDYEDITDINAIRMGINLILSSEEELAGWSSNNLLKIQNRLRESLLNLVKRERKPKEPVHFTRSYQWQQIPSEHLLTPDIQTSGNCPHVLPLLNAVNLTEDHSLQKELREHCDELYAKAGRSQECQIVKCRLCAETLHTPRELLLHLDSSKHREKEEELLK